MESNKELDVQFKEVLRKIREQIPFINSNAYLFQCRVWLEKLSAPRVDKVLRNIYLEELYKQIQNNRLSPPFNEAPPSGSLKSLTKTTFSKRSSMSRQIDNRNRGIYCRLGKKYMESTDQRKCSSLNLPMNVQESLDVCIEPLKSDEDSLEVVMPIKFFKQSLDSDQNKPLEDTKLGGGEPDNVYDDNRRKQITIDAADDSWSDITDATDEEECAKGKVKASILENHSDMENDKRVIENYHDECLDENLLKPKLQTFTLASKDGNFISEDWKKTIDALQLRLSEMIQQNNQLNIIIQNLEVKLEELNTQNQMKVESLECEYEEKIRDMKERFESQLSDISNINDSIIRRKDDEISRLTDIIQNRCERITKELSEMHNEVSACNCEKKVHLLKKCVSKMDKLFHRSEKEYMKQIEKLRQELDIKETTLQIQLKAQKADLITQTNLHRQEEFDVILNSLEIKYIKMLEAHEKQLMDMKKQDDDRIKTLKDLLLKHDISCDVINI